MELSTSCPPSLSPPPPLSISQSSTIYPVVHPVPDPTAQTGFSSVPLLYLGHKDQAPSLSFSSSYTDSEKTAQTSSYIDSSTCNNSSLLSNTNCSHEHSSSTSSSPHIEKYETIQEQEKVSQTAQGIFDDGELPENDHMKVILDTLCTVYR